MHVHPPKPLHGWREFLGEIGVIVIGVLIALGAEQAVEALHWHHQVEEERDALRSEARGSLESIATRWQQQPCVDHRLAELQTLFRRHHDGAPLGIVGTVGHPLCATAATGTWQIALAGQALAHMALDEKLEFSGTFNAFTTWSEAVDQEQAVWVQLSQIDQSALLTEEDWSRLRAAYMQATTVNDRMRYLAPLFLSQSNLGLKNIKPEALPASIQPTYDVFCKPMLS